MFFDKILAVYSREEGDSLTAARGPLQCSRCHRSYDGTHARATPSLISYAMVLGFSYADFGLGGRDLSCAAKTG